MAKEVDPKQAAAQALKKEVGGEVNPITGMSGTQLATSFWIAKHRPILRKILIGALVIIDVALVGYSVWGWGTYAFYGFWKERTMLRDMAAVHVPFKAYNAKHAPADVAPGEVLLFDSGNKAGWKDMLATIENPNERWVAEVVYHFEDGENITPTESAVVLPAESTYLGVLGFAASTTVRNPSLVIERTLWSRVSMRLAPDPAVYIAARRDFTVGEVAVNRPGATKKDVQTTQILFDVTNNTIHSYWSAPFWVLLYSNNTLAGVELVTIEPFDMGEKKSIDLRSLVSRTVTRAEVIPRLNVFDESVFKSSSL